ncbi:MAG: glycosyltransferase [Gammaproteobacteria bacterium]|nr:glycosyltransferase [Gammaproteobacteria bacterium]
MSPTDSRPGPLPTSGAPHKIFIVGVHDPSDAYPNVRYRVLGLVNSGKVAAREYGFALRWRPFARRRRWAASRLASITCTAFRAFRCHARAVAACVLHARSKPVYIPYPAPLLLCCLSFLPRSLRPGRIIADAFISLYDTAVSDRALLSGKSLPARLLRRIEQRGYRLADRVVTDTAMNAAHLTALFGLPAGKVVPLPLTIGEQIYFHVPYVPRTGPCTVLFIGTFVPLQGVDIIAQAIALLRDEANIAFRLIGYGQTGESVRNILEREDCRNYVWIEEWQDAADLAGEIRRADICLGIFGTTNKAQRVWPLKNYAYMACGRAVITGETTCALELISDADHAPFATAAIGDPAALAAGILSLARDATARTDYAQRARRFYEQHLANAASVEAILGELLR